MREGLFDRLLIALRPAQPGIHDRRRIERAVHGFAREPTTAKTSSTMTTSSTPMGRAQDTTGILQLQQLSRAERLVACFQHVARHGTCSARPHFAHCWAIDSRRFVAAASDSTSSWCTALRTT
jgi:hypothetical protein